MFSKLEKWQIDREISAINCKNLTEENAICHQAIANCKNGWMASRFCLPKFTGIQRYRLLPNSLVSGRVVNEEFWTDGAILLRWHCQSKTDFFVKFDNPIASLLERGERIKWMCRLSNVSLYKRAFVYLRSESIEMLVQERYLDLALTESGRRCFGDKRGKYQDNVELYFNKLMTGCILEKCGEVSAYISMYRPPIRMFLKVKALAEEWNANCRN